MYDVATAPILTRGEPLAILAGGGSLPRIVAAAAERAGRPVIVIGIRGEADDSITAFPHRWIGWGDIGRALVAVKQHKARELVLVGWIGSRPDFRKVPLDRAARLVQKQIVGIFAGGDNAVLLGAVRLFEMRGFRVVGAHEIARELTVGPGLLTQAQPDQRQRADGGLAFTAAKTIGALDVGQAAVAINGRVVALEGAEGTDGMIDRVGAMRASGRIGWTGSAGALAKCAKPHQDLRVDMPTVGPGTVGKVVAAGLAGIVVEAGRVMIAEREETIRLANANGLFLQAIEGAETAS